MNIKLIFTTALVALVTFGLQAMVPANGIRPVTRPVATATTKPTTYAKPTTQARPAATAPRTTTTTQQRAAAKASRGGRTGAAFF